MQSASVFTGKLFYWYIEINERRSNTLLLSNKVATKSFFYNVDLSNSLDSILSFMQLALSI